jgi:uncharacterized protein YidB (DUF937 family)
MRGKGAGRANRFAIHAVAPCGGLAAHAGLVAGTELDHAGGCLEFGGDGEAAGSARAGTGREFGAAQAPALGQQRDRLEEVGLAAAVLAGHDHHLPVDQQIERGIGAEIRQHQAADRHRRAGIPL